MATTAEKQARIDQIDAILAGASSFSANNRSVNYDFPALRQERSDLRRSISSNSGGFRRVVFKSSV